MIAASRAWSAGALAVVLLCAGCASTQSRSAANEKEVDLVGLNREAQLALESGETAKAEALYKSLVRRMPNDSETWLRLGNLYARNNKPDEAVGAYQRALIANNTEARAWHNLAVVRLRQAWAALLQVQAQENLAADDPLRIQAEEALDHLEKLPFLSGEQRKAKAGADASKF